MIATAKEFGATLSRARKALGLTQRQLAMSIGVGERFIVDLEAGKPTAQLGKALAAAKAAGMHLCDTAETFPGEATSARPRASRRPPNTSTTSQA
jgi:y4mF family transcriptional regulator